MAEIIICAILLLTAVITGLEFRKFKLRDIITLAILTAIAVAGRVLFSGSIPSVQLSSYVIIMTGMLFGPAGGFYVGIATPLLSNLMLSMGPWLLYQMLCWGMMGTFAALFKNRNIYITSAYGLVWGFIFGFIMNCWWMFSGMIPVALETVIVAQMRSFSFDLAHGVTNAVLLMALPLPLISRLMKMANVNTAHNLKDRSL